MKTIRSGTFETNSSSTHALSISTDPQYQDDFKKVELSLEGDLILPAREFGWETERYNDIVTKATYVGILVNTYKYNDKVTGWIDSILKEAVDCKSVIHDYLTMKNGDICLKNNCYIDHCGEADNIEVVTTDYDTLKNFLTNKDSWLFTGNDNGRENPNQRWTKADWNLHIGWVHVEFPESIPTSDRLGKCVYIKNINEIPDAIYYLVNDLVDKKLLGFRYDLQEWAININYEFDDILANIEEGEYSIPFTVETYDYKNKTEQVLANDEFKFALKYEHNSQISKWQ